MKRKLCILLAAALLLALCGCRVGNASYHDAGRYEVFLTTDGENTMTRAEYEAQDWTISLRLDGSGTGELDMGGGERYELSWRDGSLTMNGETVPYVMADGLLSVALVGSNGPFIMLFSRTGTDSGNGEDAGLSEILSGAAPAGTMTVSEPFVPAETPAPAAVPEASGGDLKGGHVEFISAEAFENYNGKPAVRFYYDYTNTSDFPASAAMWLRPEADEDGYPLMYTFANNEDDVPEYGNTDRMVLPGVTIRCVSEFVFNPDGNVVTLSFADEDGRMVAGSFDAQALKGRPGDWQPEPVPAPEWYSDLGRYGSTEDADIAILAAELGTEAPDMGYGDGRILRAYFDFSNEGDSEMYMTSMFSYEAYQDGIALPMTMAEEQNYADEAAYELVWPGYSIEAARCWALRSDSPVLVTVTDWLSGNIVCAELFPVSGAAG